MAEKWGNPDTKSFERQYLRWAQYGDLRIQVHKHIWPLVERMLVGLDQAGVNVSTAASADDDPLFVSFLLPGADPDVVNPAIEAASFVYEGGHVLFKGTADEAAGFSAQLAAQAVAEPEPEPVPTEEPRADTAPPYARTIEDPSTIRFLQLLTGATATGVMDEGSEVALRDWKRRHGLDDTPEVDDEVWSNVLPRRASWLRPGQTGAQIKALQAAFIERGYLPESQTVDGVWGITFSKALRRFQHDYGIHPRLRVGNPEWDALFVRAPLVVTSEGENVTQER